MVLVHPVKFFPPLLHLAGVHHTLKHLSPRFCNKYWPALGERKVGGEGDGTYVSDFTAEHGAELLETLVKNPDAGVTTLHRTGDPCLHCWCGGVIAFLIVLVVVQVLALYGSGGKAAAVMGEESEGSS